MFSLSPNTQTSRFALCLWQPDYLYCLFFSRQFFVFEFATHTRADSFYGYLANIHNILTSYQDIFHHLSQLSCRV